jgi:predicted ATPase
MAEDLRSFVGRAAELAELRETMADARSRRPQAVLISGPPGIGKTSLIDQFLLELDHAKVLRASGEQWEALVAFGVIDQLLRTAGISKGLLLAGRNRSLPPEEPVVVGAVFLEALEALEHEAPVVLVIDDAQWADVDSLRAVLFALRRLSSSRVLTLLVERNEDTTRLPDGLRRLASGTTGRPLHLDALGSSEIRTLAAAFGVDGFTVRTAQRLRDHTGGNPLYVRAMLSELPMDRWRTWQPLLPAPRAFVAQVMSRLSACSPPARALVEACSVLGVRSSLRMAAALAELDEPVGALEEAAALELLQGIDRMQIWDVTFPHPLVQAAVYEHVNPTRRVRLHRAAAALVEDAGTALRHRVAAATPPDGALAATLDDFARVEMQWGAWPLSGSRTRP